MTRHRGLKLLFIFFLNFFIKNQQTHDPTQGIKTSLALPPSSFLFFINKPMTRHRGLKLYEEIFDFSFYVENQQTHDPTQGIKTFNEELYNFQMSIVSTNP